jgi:uncharacterized protein YjdB
MEVTMRAIILSRLVAIIGSAGAIIACNDSVSPTPPSGSGGSGSGVHSGISVVPRTATIEAGQVVTLRASLIDEFGDPLEGGFSWRSSNDAVATVASTGDVYGRSEGVVTVTASALGKSQSSTVHVLRRGPKPQ